jgi:hypothetical protein
MVDQIACPGISHVDIVESLENVLALSQPRLANMTVERRFAPNLPTIKAFGSELQQAWQSLDRKRSGLNVWKRNSGSPNQAD